MEHGRKQAESDEARGTAQRVRLSGTKSSAIGRSLRQAFKADAPLSSTREFDDLLRKLA